MAGVVLADERRGIEFRTIGVAPYGIQGKPDSGIYYEAAELLLEDAGYPLSNFIAPYARIIKELKAGTTDATIMFKYEELEGHVTYIAPFDTLKIVVIGLKGRSYPSIESLKGKRLAYLRGAKFSDEIDNEPEITRQDTIDFSQGLKMLELGRVDAIIGPLDPLLYTAAKLFKKQDFFGKPLLVGERTPWLQVSKKSADRISVEKLEDSFKKMQLSGQLDVIRNKYINFKHEY